MTYRSSIERIGMEIGMKKGMQHGRQEGRQEGRSCLPSCWQGASASSMGMATATAEQLSVWGANFVDARSLADVFRSG